VGRQANVAKQTPLMIDAGCTQVIIVNSGFTRPKFTKFVHDVLIVAAVNTPNGIAIFQSVSEERLMKLSRPDLPIYPLKLVAMATSLDRSEKGQINNIRPNIYRSVKL